MKVPATAAVVGFGMWIALAAVVRAADLLSAVSPGTEARRAGAAAKGSTQWTR